MIGATNGGLVAGCKIVNGPSYIVNLLLAGAGFPTKHAVNAVYTGQYAGKNINGAYNHCNNTL